MCVATLSFYAGCQVHNQKKLFGIFQELHQKYKQRVHCYSPCMGFLTLSDPDSEDTDEADECCWGLEMDMGESALWGDTESLCCSSDPTPPPSTQFSCSDTGFLGGDTKEIGLVVRIYIMLKKNKKLKN